MQALGLALPLALSAHADTASGDALFDQRLAELRQLHEQGRLSACVDQADALRPQARERGAVMHLQVESIALLCRYHDDTLTSEEVRAAEFDARIGPLMTQVLELARVDVPAGVARVVSDYSLLASIGAGRVGEMRFDGWLHERLAKRPEPGTADAFELAETARSFHGNWQMHARLQKLLVQYRQALGPAHPASLVALRAVGYHERYLGRGARARELADEAWQLAQDNPAAAPMRPQLLMDLAVTRAITGDGPEAMPIYLAALQAFEAQVPRNRISIARAHTHLALLQLQLGDFDDALSHAEAGQRWATEEGTESSRQEGYFIGAAGDAARLLRGDADGAARLRRSLELCTPHEMHAGQHATLLALHAARVGDAELLAWTQRFLDDQVNRFRAPLHADRAVLAWLKQRTEGGGMAEAWLLALPERDPAVGAMVEFELARQSRQGGQADAAIWHGKRAVLALMRDRADASRGSASLPRGNAVRHEADIEQLAADLVDAGRLAEADQALRALHDEELQSYRRASRGARAQASSTLGFGAQEQHWQQAVRPVAAQMEALLAESEQSFDAIGDRGPRQLYREPAQRAARFAALQGELRPWLSPQGAAVVAAEPQPSPSALPQGVARLALWSQGGRLRLLLQREGRPIRVLQWELAPHDLATAIQAHRRALAEPGGDARSTGQRLFGMLLAPLQAELRGVRELRLAPEGVLRYVNFAALHDGRGWAVERWVLLNEGAPSADAGPAKLKRWLAAGRSAGDDQHAPLPAVEQELDALARDGARVLRNADFAAAALRQALAEQPDVVHLASHYRFDPVSEARSYLLLGSGERVSLPELRELPWRGVRLVVLSACESGLPAELAGQSGKEWLGLADGLHRAGVANVVAAQWRIDDAASAELMAAMHHRLVRMHRVDPAALAAVQRDWLRRHARRPLAHPHYWAGFTWLRG